ncbi:MAG: Gx transporter family protein [Clostridia bacterium]|nr:Gx transporter family protein [Clostridia bacterium]
MKRLSAKRIAFDGILTAVALVLHVVEQLVPLPIPVPGVKLGLANVTTLFAAFAFGPVDAGIILLVRIFLGSLFSGQVTGLLYSLAGGSLCYLVTILLRRVLSDRQMWFCGIAGAIFHNIGQIIVAVFLTSTPEITYYLPVLIVAGTLTGLFTGLAAQFLLIAIKERTDLLS